MPRNARALDGGAAGGTQAAQPSPLEHQLGGTGSDWQQSALHLDNTCNEDTKDSPVRGVPRLFSELFVSTASTSIVQ